MTPGVRTVRDAAFELRVLAALRARGEGLACDLRDDVGLQGRSGTAMVARTLSEWGPLGEGIVTSRCVGPLYLSMWRLA